MAASHNVNRKHDDDREEPTSHLNLLGYVPCTWRPARNKLPAVGVSHSHTHDVLPGILCLGGGSRHMGGGPGDVQLQLHHLLA